MEKFYYPTVNGLEVTAGDLTLVSGNAAVADDRIIAELFRPKPYDSISMTEVTKFILAHSRGETIAPNGASGSVRIYPFRPVVASPTEASSNARENWRDIRSAIYVGNLTGEYLEKSISANTSGDPRWDLLYVRLDKDVSDAAVTRIVATPGDPIVETPTSISITQSTLVTVGTVIGTPSPTPTPPTAPSDGAGSFYIPLAYIVVPDGFSATSIVLPEQIFEVFPTVPLSNVTGVTSVKPASAMNTPGGDVLTSTVMESWGSTSTRPEVYMPPSMTGEEVIYVALNMQDASSSNWSQQSDTVVDDSRDWRDRLFFWTAQTVSSGIHKFAWDPNAATGSVLPHDDSANVNSSTARMAFGMGRSFDADIAGQAVVCKMDNDNLGGDIDTGEYIYLTVDMTDGKLYVTTSTTPGVRVFIRLCASSQYTNN